MTKQNQITGMFVGTFPQILAALAGTINAISDGMQYGWSAPVIPILKSEESPIRISTNDESWLETTYLLGSLTSLPITIYAVDKIGRKYTILLSSLTSILAWTLIGVAPNVECLYVARFLAGIAGDVAFVAAPMYVAEIADQKIRGFLSGIIYLMMMLGVLIIYSMAPFVPFYAPSILAGGLLVLQLITFSLMPESPYYLLGKNKNEKAAKSLNWLRSKEDNNEELTQISLALKRQQEEERGKPQDLILIKSNRTALIIIVVLNAGQHFCGITVLMMNIHLILEAAGSIYLDSNLSAILFATFMVLSASISTVTVDKYGRKILMILSSILTGICLLVIACYYHLKDLGEDIQTVSWIPVASVMIYAVVFKFGLGMIPIVMTAELFSSKTKAIGMTIADGVYVLGGFLSIELYQNLSYLYGIHVSFYVFAALSFCMAIFSVFVLPETKGKTLEEIQLMLKGEYKKSNSSNNINSNNTV